MAKSKGDGYQKTSASNRHDRDNHKTEPPPAYTPYAGDEEKLMLAEKERLRRFLSVLLSMDYGMRKHCPDKLLKDDWLHYTRLSGIALKVFSTHHRPDPTRTILLDWSDVCCHHPEVDEYIKKPARALGIQTSKVSPKPCKCHS